MAIKSCKDPKSSMFKNLKKPLVFCRFLGSRGLPREPQETQEGSQKVPRELQNLPKKRSKNRPRKSRVLERFWVRFGSHFGGQKWTKKEPKKDPKNDPQNDPKKAPPRTAKIAPSRPVLGPFPPRSYTPNRTCTLTSIQEPTTIIFFTNVNAS